MKYRLSPLAKRDLRGIKDYYKSVDNLDAGVRLVESVISCVELLTTHPHLGYPEPILEEFSQSFRCLVDVPYYKIIYWIEEDIIKIATVFDCRQRPEIVYQLINNRPDWVCEPPVEYNPMPHAQQT